MIFIAFPLKTTLTQSIMPFIKRVPSGDSILAKYSELFQSFDDLRKQLDFQTIFKVIYNSKQEAQKFLDLSTQYLQCCFAFENVFSFEKNQENFIAVEFTWFFLLKGATRRIGTTPRRSSLSSTRSSASCTTTRCCSLRWATFATPCGAFRKSSRGSSRSLSRI